MVRGGGGLEGGGGFWLLGKGLNFWKNCVLSFEWCSY